MLRPIARALLSASASIVLALGACGPMPDGGDGDGDTAGDGDMTGDGDGDMPGDGDGDTAGDGDGDGDGDGPPECVYPVTTGNPQSVGDVMPPLVWAGVNVDGETVDFSLEEFHCNEGPNAERWASYDTITFVLVATWCPNCPSYMQQMNAWAADLENAGSLLVYLVMQNNSYARASNTVADQYVTSKLNSANAPGLRIGDGALQQVGALDYTYTFVPNGFVVRKRDMQIIAHQEVAGNFIPYPNVAADPEADWSTGLPPFMNQCGDTPDESSEPNNSPAEAAPLTAPTSFSGGICDQSPDIYFIDIAGPVRIDLLFSHAVGDLDIHRINEAGESLQQAWTVTDNEQMDFTGPALIAVVGYTGASAPYELILSQPE